VIIDCTGRLVLGEESAALREQAHPLLSNKGRIILNFANVTRIDSGGLGTLVALYATANNLGASIKLACLGERLTDLLQMTKLLTVFEVYDTERRAIQSFGTSAVA
jgi:anti-sigma B factor antagonist